MVIEFGDRDLRALWETGKSKGVRADLQKRARLAIAALHHAAHLRDVHPSFRVHALSGARAPRHAMKVGQPWRLTFLVADGGTRATDLRLEQYH